MPCRHPTIIACCVVFIHLSASRMFLVTVSFNFQRVVRSPVSDEDTENSGTSHGKLRAHGYLLGCSWNLPPVRERVAEDRGVHAVEYWQGRASDQLATRAIMRRIMNF